MFDFLRPAARPPACDACPYVPGMAEREERDREAERTLAAASKTNSRAAMGLVATHGQSMRVESGIQAILRGALREVDRDDDADH
ncbi:hypothetical protein [Methylobacterium isbiliense]|jgi:hypothetical protein|uniref:Uncharacterized protein n=1 Tax=Methylobacterium isbiliense TaxID=315478 RepID=A0ABQ4S9P3_9HYPH|nr:hypothetical protein [Methylobacterium isbiliense]MDN3622709.1 hypothetical protein [Methylobacterium isbiliense]GJD99894.1 hypothetical protein GMJLKIPL_1812 [Methylobacterium isbiliense]